MIRADVGPSVAARRTTDHRPSMRAAIDPRRQAAVVVACYHDGCGANERAFEVARIRQLDVQRDETPGRSAEDPRLLRVIDVGGAIDVVWYA